MSRDEWLDREFQLWHYEVTHSSLLVRSVLTPAASSRVDVLFEGVREVRLPSVMHGLEISTSDLSRAGADPLSRSPVEPRVTFHMQGHGWSGLVVALSFNVNERLAGYADPAKWKFVCIGVS